MKQIINTIGLVLLLSLTNNSLAQAQHGVVQGDTIWFTSDTSSMLNRSSVELATNHANRGIRFAYRALAEELNPIDELVAYHNLCIGYLASDRPEYAAEFCALTKELAQVPYNVVKIRGAFRIQESVAKSDINDNQQTTLSAMQVIVNNIQQQYPDTRLSLLMK
ncbi:MAG: hypothetical protein DRQ48_05985 [Gammaproteobacteria bacterium]|nr:MAG: hypothetical protein DRQ48_05985 [Gammaproteobacteria bacterium]